MVMEMKMKELVDYVVKRSDVVMDEKTAIRTFLKEETVGILILNKLLNCLLKNLELLGKYEYTIIPMNEDLNRYIYKYRVKGIGPIDTQEFYLIIKGVIEEVSENIYPEYKMNNEASNICEWTNKLNKTQNYFDIYECISKGEIEKNRGCGKSTILRTLALYYNSQKGNDVLFVTPYPIHIEAVIEKFNEMISCDELKDSYYNKLFYNNEILNLEYNTIIKVISVDNISKIIGYKFDSILIDDSEDVDDEVISDIRERFNNSKIITSRTK